MFLNTNYLLIKEVFELVDSFSVSDIWRAWSMNSTSDFILKSLSASDHGVFTKKNKEILSIIFKAQAIKIHNSVNDKVHVFKSQFKVDNTKDEQTPSSSVILYFIKSDLQKHCEQFSRTSNCLYINLIWKVNILYF